MGQDGPMAKLIYSAIASLDGYTVDENGDLDWAAPDEEVHAFVNELERPIGRYLYGRRMYEVMRYWETAPTEGDAPRVVLDYAALWKAADKIVYSGTLESVSTNRTTLRPVFEPDAIRSLKESSDRDISIGGAGLAAHAFRAGLVDECHLFLVPVLVGGGTRALPDHVRANLGLLTHHRFPNGTIHLHHQLNR
jgi:dihydrofolate reductase